MRSVVVGCTLAALVGIVGLLEACGEDVNAPSTRRSNADVGGDAGADGINATGAGAGTGANTGLPCDVQQLLENRCIGCHLAASPPALLTYDDLLKSAPSAPSKTLAQVSLERMRNTASPMPPAPAEVPTAEEIQVFQAWVSAGTPKGAACTSPPGADGGAGAGGTIFNTPSVCTSKKTWNGGNDGSSSMRPGGACITCHTMRGGPAYRVAGTVYPTAHEPNDCNGVAGGLTVVVTDANGTVVNVTVNGAGNFYSRAQIVPPFHVKVTNGTKERVMVGSLTAGDCNSCHTETGVNSAPGRIVAP